MSTTMTLSKLKTPSFVAACLMMAGLYLKTVLRTRKSWAIVGIAGLGWAVAAFALFRSVSSGADSLYASLLKQLPFGFLAQFAALLYGTAVVREEVESRTLTYLLVRPLPRRAILLGRWLAATTTVVVLVAVFTLALHLVATWVIHESSRRMWPIVAVSALGAAYYTAAFTAIGTLFRRPLLLGLAYILFWEIPLPLVPSDAAALSIKYHLLNLVDLAARDVYVPALAGPTVAHQTSLWVVALATLVLTAVSLAVFPQREYLSAAQNV